jgi:class 3 adenylate cyclase/tetratricopeptide (TPR) repeat protein
MRSALARGWKAAVLRVASYSARALVPSVMCLGLASDTMLAKPAGSAAIGRTSGVIVDCASCGHKNLKGTRFCVECGSSLATTMSCPGCGAENPGEHKFCGACGHALSGAGSPAAQVVATHTVPGTVAPTDPRAHLPEHLAQKIQGAKAEIEGERKQVTVMFVDIVDSMDLAETLDSERWRGLLDRFFAIVSDAVHSVEGTIDKFTGDGVMALFGAPVSHEDHARRACLAALQLHASLAPLAADLADEAVAVAIRVGLNSGEVIVGEIGDEGRMSYTAIGHTVGLAQRMESLAPAGSTALSAATASLVPGEFELPELGEFKVKGSSVLQRVFELVGKAPSRDRVEAAGARGGLSPFVGRDREQAALQAALERALEGDGQAVALVGEPGVGKSRLAHEFTERHAAEGISVQRTRAVAHGRETPLLPVLELIRTTLGVVDSDEPAITRRRIAESLEALDQSFHEALPLLFDFLGVGDPERPAPKMDPEARQRQLLSLVRRFVQARSRIQTAVTLIEDLHWLDDASGVFVADFVRAIAGTRTLLILTYRPEYAGEILRGSHCERLALRPLSQKAVGELLAGLLGDDRSLDGLAELIAQRAIGNPFFCEELVAALAESGHLVGERGSYRLGRTLEEIVLPATVQATLGARIDRLEAREKDLLQIASVIGYELEEPVLHAVSGLPGIELSDALASLVSAELLSERMGKTGLEYAFRHPLTHEVAYRSQLSDRRRQVHREAALAIEQLYPEKLDELAALVAQHWEAAGETLAAARWNARAADWVGLSDISQAVARWRKVSELTEILRDSPEATGLALGAHVRQLEFGWRLGLTEQEAESHYEAGRELAKRSDNRLMLLMITGQYANVRGTAGHVEQYGELGAEVNRLSIEIGDPQLRIAAITVPVYSKFVLGRLGEALDLVEEGVALGTVDPTLGAGLSTVVCPYAWCLMMKGLILCFMGRLDAAARELDLALRVAREQGDLEFEGSTHTVSVWRARCAGETETVLAHATEARDIAEHIGSAFAGLWSLNALGYAHLMLGNASEAIGAFEQSIELARGARTGLEAESWLFAGLSEALLSAGDHVRALEAAQESVTLALGRGNRAILPLSYRVLAEALLASDGQGRIAAAREALADATSAAQASGARAELPFIDRARERVPAG